MSLDRWCTCGRPADAHGACHDCDADRAFPVALNQVVVEPSWVTVELCSRDAGTISAQIPRAVFAELFRRVAQR